MSEAKVPLDKYQRMENLFATQSKLVVMTGGFFLIGHAVLFFAFAAAHGGWFKVILGLFGILMAVGSLIFVMPFFAIAMYFSPDVDQHGNPVTFPKFMFTTEI